MSENNSVKNLLVKTLFVIGIIIIILVLAFAIIQIIPRIFSSFNNVSNVIDSPFTNKELDIDVNSTNVDSGDVVFLSWDYNPKESGVYELQYGCANYLNVELGTSQGNRTLQCNTVYQLSPESDSASIIPTVSRENVLVDLPINLSFVNRSGDVIKKGEIEISVSKADTLAGSGSIIETEVVDTNTNNNTDTNTTNNTTPVVVSTRPADLFISNLISGGDTLVSFTVSNIGGRPTGNWTFRYEMPDGDIEFSPLQPSLNPGDAIRYTLRFEDVPEGDVEIDLDPFNAIAESNENNNRRDIEIDGDISYNYDEDDDANLEIDEMEVGYLRGSRFIEDDRIDEDDDAAVRFVVVNTGGEDTGRWRFEIENLPYDDDDDYESSRQSSLEPGESVEIIIEFENPDEGNYNIKVIIDSDDDVDEEDERDNDESERLEVRD